LISLARHGHGHGIRVHSQFHVLLAALHHFFANIVAALDVSEPRAQREQASGWRCGRSSISWRRLYTSPVGVVGFRSDADARTQRRFSYKLQTQQR